MKFLGAGKVSSKHMTTIPKNVREKLNLKVGEYLLFYERDGEIIIRKE